ncbi:MAG: hypothetical protein LBD85_01820 [Oscillospiraceae bacterium]|jgi:hypothetical protein|nr:hypothetical protein [Oscillospiraceae bacterium]
MESQNQENTALPVLQARLNETTKAIENILNAIRQGILTPSTKERLESLEQAKEELEMDILQEELFRPFVSEDKVRFWLYKFREGDLQDPEHYQRLVDASSTSFTCSMTIFRLLSTIKRVRKPCRWPMLRLRWQRLLFIRIYMRSAKPNGDRSAKPAL